MMRPANTSPRDAAFRHIGRRKPIRHQRLTQKAEGVTSPINPGDVNALARGGSAARSRSPLACGAVGLQSARIRVLRCREFGFSKPTSDVSVRRKRARETVKLLSFPFPKRAFPMGCIETVRPPSPGPPLRARGLSRRRRYRNKGSTNFASWEQLCRGAWRTALPDARRAPRCTNTADSAMSDSPRRCARRSASSGSRSTTLSCAR